MRHRALAFAVDLSKRHPIVDEQIQAAFKGTYGRPVSDDELQACRKHFEESLKRHRTEHLKPVPLPSRVHRGMIEEFTGQMVYWDEDLPLADYQRDTMPWEVAPEVRALADVCLVLFNSNEFLYVR